MSSWEEVTYYAGGFSRTLLEHVGFRRKNHLRPLNRTASNWLDKSETPGLIGRHLFHLRLRRKIPDYLGWPIHSKPAQTSKNMASRYLTSCRLLSPVDQLRCNPLSFVARRDDSPLWRLEGDDDLRITSLRFKIGEQLRQAAKAALLFVLWINTAAHNQTKYA